MPTTGSPSGRRGRQAAPENAESVASGPASPKSTRRRRTTDEAAGKKAVSKGAAAKKPAKKVAKKTAAKKTAAKKVAKKTAAKKTAAKKVAKKAPKKGSRKPAAARKATAKKKSAAKKVAKKATRGTSAEKSAGKRTARKAAATKKTAAKKKPAKKRSARHKPTTITRRVARKRPTGRSKKNKPVIGWREWVVLPEFTSTPIKAKVDSGAVTSSLHAFNLQISTDGGQTMARFGVAPKQGSHAAKTIVEHPIVGFKKVRSSNGQAELRPVIRTVAVIGEKSFEIDVTLASRDDMGFRMLLGRRAVRNRFVIDPGRSFLQPPAPDGDLSNDQ